MTAGKCCSCMSRRQCVSMLSVAALGLIMGKPSRYIPQLTSTDYVDVTKLRPRPKVRIVSAILEYPRPYWLGWPGTTYDLDAHQNEFRSKLDDSCNRLGISVDSEPKSINEEAGLVALVNRVKDSKPDGLLITFEMYQVAPGASGPMQVLVPYEHLQTVIDPQGPLAGIGK